MFLNAKNKKKSIAASLNLGLGLDKPHVKKMSTAAIDFRAPNIDIDIKKPALDVRGSQVDLNLRGPKIGAGLDLRGPKIGGP